MSIPLVKKLDLDSVNTTIIAIKRLLQQAGVSEGGNTIINNNSDGSVPLGTWASFENDSAPNGEWLQGGTTFDANTYPALAMMLGGNTIPERFDHSRLGNIESAPASGFTADYDGVLYGSRRNNGIAVSINNVEVMYSEVTGEPNGYFPWTVDFKKGDYITYQSGSGGSHLAKVAYYKHPLFIKATPTSSDSDYEGTLNSIREFYVRNNTYSTEERLTGGVWIDGKPIYRISVEDISNTSTSPSAISTSAYTILSSKNIDRVIKANWDRPKSGSYNAYSTPLEIEITSSSIKKKGMSSASGYTGCYLTIEYTKTT